MADTLAEIYRNTLTSSDFDANGEATIVTTNSSTSHVIKNIQAEDTDANVKVNGTLKVNDFDVVALTGSSSGSEIIAPSSTVKVKTSALPLTYLDYEFSTRTGGTNYKSHTIATANGTTAISEIYDATNSVVDIQATNDRDIYAPFLGSNNYHLIIVQDTNSVTNLYLYDSSGNAITSKTASYEPKWFDGKQYAYFHNGSGAHGIHKVDCYTGNTTVLINNSMSNGGTYPKMFGYKDEYLWFWARYDADTPQVYSFADNNLTSWTNGTANSSVSGENKNWYAVKRSGDRYRLVFLQADNDIRFYDWAKGTVLTSSVTPTTISLSSNTEQLKDFAINVAVIGSRLYYVNGANNIAFIDFEADTPTKGVIGTNDFSGGYGSDIQQVERTPSNSTISGRSGYPNPSLKLRVTGVTST
jgi:hypothetical protein